MFKELIVELEDSLLNSTMDHSTLYGLALIHGGAGDYKMANEYVESLEALKNSTKSKLRENTIEDLLIELYIVTKQFESAMELIKKHVQGPYRTIQWSSCSIMDLKLHPIYDPLRNFPQFVALVNKGN